MIFRCEDVATPDDDGHLDGVGVRWTEPRIWCEWGLRKLAECVVLGAFGVLLLGGLAMLGGTAGPIVPIAIAGLFGLAGGLMWMEIHLPGRERELTFWRDGLAYAPLGLSTWRWDHDRCKSPHPYIKSIEAEQLVFPKAGEDPPPIYTHGVRIFMRNGEVVHIARNLEPDDAHMLAVRLTKARADLRSSMVAIVSAQRRDAAAPRAKETLELID